MVTGQVTGRPGLHSESRVCLCHVTVATRVALPLGTQDGGPRPAP